MSAGTVFSVLTPAGRGAVAVVAVAGSGAVQAVERSFQAKNRKPLLEQRIARIVYGNWRFRGEDLIVCRRGEELVEIHCHGGHQAVATIVADLANAGAEQMPWQEWLARGDTCPLRVQAQIALAQATSTRTALILLDQFHGALERSLREIIDLLKTDEVRACQGIERLLATAELGLHLTRPWQVVIAGRPNVGKSSLINALVGYQRAIVFDQPGTTRDVVTASTVIDGWPVTLSDTAGLHGTSDQLEAAGIELAKERLAAADLVIWVLDAMVGGSNVWEERANSEIDELQLSINCTPLVVVNKIDQCDGLQVPQGILATSAVTAAGIDQLLAMISERLVPTVPKESSAVLFTERQNVSAIDALQCCRQGDLHKAAETLLNLLKPC